MLLNFGDWRAKKYIMGKYIVCDTALENQGKTKTLLKVIEKLKVIVTPNIERLINDEDKYASFLINGKRIVIVTIGDPISEFSLEIDLAIEEKADIIVCASRTRGTTFTEINDKTKNGYEIIRFSNFFAVANGRSYEPRLHNVSAEAIVKLIQIL